jgi:hypothetical protein
MGIEGLTGKRPRVPVGGVLKKGEEKAGPNKFGADLGEAFRFEGKGNPAHKRAIEAAFLQYFGTHPTSLQVWFVHPRASDNFEAWREAYGSGNWLKNRCDGRSRCHYWNGKHYSQDPLPCQHDRAAGKCPLECDDIGRLSVWIPELFRHGFYHSITVQTGSLNDIADLDEQLAYYDSLADDIRGVTFTLRRKPEEHYRPGFDKQGNRTEARGKAVSWFIELAPPVGWLEERLIAIAMEREPTPPQEKAEALGAFGKPPAVGYEESEIEKRAGRLCELADLPWFNFRVLVRKNLKKTPAELTEIEYLKARSLVLINRIEIDYGYSQDQIILLLRDFLASNSFTDDGDLFSAWRGYVQNYSTGRRLGAS